MNTTLYSEQISLLHMARPSLRSVTTHLTCPAAAYLSTQRGRLPRPLRGLDFTTR